MDETSIRPIKERLYFLMKSKNLRIVFMGTPEFAVESLKKLVDNGYNIVGGYDYDTYDFDPPGAGPGDPTISVAFW